MADGDIEANDDAYWQTVREWFASLSRWQSLGEPRPSRRAEPVGDERREHPHVPVVDVALRRARDLATADLLAGELRQLLWRRPDLDPSTVRQLLRSLADEYEHAARPQSCDA